MTGKRLRQRVVVRDGVLADFERIHRRVLRLQMAEGKGSDLKQIMALLEQMTTITGVLVSEAEEIRRQIMALQHGLLATTAYRHTQNLASGRATGDRK